MVHTLLFAALTKLGFGKYFVELIKVLLNKNVSCVVNGETTFKYFDLERGARQGDPIAAYLFIVCPEIFFITVRSDKRVKSLNILTTQ